MHPCLSVDEILRFLARELVASNKKATAVSLACCCKCFEDPVLDTLWETQNELIPLLKSLPKGVWKMEVGRFVSPLTALTFFSSYSSTEEVFQETPNERGMESFPKICWGNADALSGRRQGPGNFRRYVSAAIPHRRQTFASEVGDLQVHKGNQGFHPVYPPLSLREHYGYIHLIRVQLLQSSRRIDNRQVSDTLPPHQFPYSQIPTNRSSHGRGCL